MMSSFMFEPHHTVLLIGEGNFSFSCCILKVTEQKYGISNFSNVYSSCFQKDKLSNCTLENIKYLQDRGAVVFLGIDATNLTNEYLLKDIKFEKVIFNFPHIGGKMKIHLNRKLLHDFFKSVTSVLSPKGLVVVSLCSGQGGTGFEEVQRRWDDTWQVVEQAASSDFVLVNVEYFPSELLKDYRSVGYRGIEKSFNTNKAVVHTFRKSVPLITEVSVRIDLLSLVPLEENSDVLLSIAHKRAIDNNPFKNEDSPQSVLLVCLFKISQALDEHLTKIDHLPFDTEFKINQPVCRIAGIERSLRCSLLQVIPEDLRAENYFFSGLVFHQFQKDFINVANCEVVLKSSHFREIIGNFLTDMIFQFEANCTQHFTKDSWYLCVSSGRTLVASYSSSDGLLTIHIDELASCLFSVSSKALWADGCHVSGTKLILPSLYSRSYSFDVSFLSMGDIDMSQFFYALHQLPEDIVQSAELLSCYEFNNNKKSYCFKITYKSYSKPLCRKRVLDYHANVLGVLISHSLNLQVI